ncbi:hypothetical protein Vretimale_4280, partial [Volvox reticuliferus]
AMWIRSSMLHRAILLTRPPPPSPLFPFPAELAAAAAAAPSTSPTAPNGALSAGIRARLSSRKRSTQPSSGTNPAAASADSTLDSACGLHSGNLPYNAAHRSPSSQSGTVIPDRTTPWSRLASACDPHSGSTAEQR